MVEQWVQWSGREEDHDDDDNHLNHDHGYFNPNNRLSQSLQYLDWIDLYELIDKMDDSVEMISEQYKQKLQSIRHQLTKENFVLRASYKGYSFHMYSANDFERQASEYIKKMGIYKLIEKMNITDPKVTQLCLSTMIEQIQTRFDELRCAHQINDRQYEQMRLNRSYAELNYLYFTLHMNKADMNLVRPMMICHKGPTIGISHYLSQLLWSILKQRTGCRTFSNGADIVQLFEFYSKTRSLQSTTHFVTFNMNEFCVKFQHEEIIKVLQSFLSTYGTEENMQGLTIETMIELIRLVLQNQFFIYHNKLYQQTKGGASGSPLTFPLACIYMFHSRPALMTALIDNHHQKELFGRFRDDMFLTWNRSEEELYSLFNIPKTISEEKQQQQQQEIIQIVLSIGTSFSFLDVQIWHTNGILHTKIYHDLVMDQYELPNKFEQNNGTRQPSKLLQALLIYAVRCCSEETSFHYERNYIKLIYLLYGFSAHFIDDCIQEFYKQFHASELHYLVDRIPYEILRQRVMNYYQQLNSLKNQWSTQIKTMQTIPYSNYSDPPMMTYFKHHFLKLLNNYFIYQPQFNEDEIELFSHLDHDILLSMNHYLINQKPLRRLLTLSDDQRKETNRMYRFE